MALKVFTLLALLTSSLSHVIAIHQQCIDTLCNIATGCDKSQENCLGTGNAYCGPFRLSHRFWKDAGAPGSTFKSCIFDYTCSVETINLYMSKYARDCNADGQIDCDDFAAIHLAGGELSCSQKWLFSSNRYKKYLTLMSPESSSRTHGVNVYDVMPRVSSAGPSYHTDSDDNMSGDRGEEKNEKEKHYDDADDITFIPSSSSSSFNVSASPYSAGLRDSRRGHLHHRRRSTRTPSSRRYTVIYWNGNRRRLPEITNLLDNNPWIIESARRTSPNDIPISSNNPPISRRTYFNPTTPLTSTTNAPRVTPVTSTTDSFVPSVPVTRRRRVRPRTNRRPLVVNNPPGRRPSGRRPSSNPPVTTVTVSTTTVTADDSSFSPLSTPAPSTTVVTRPTTRRVTTSSLAPVTERPVRSTTPQAWWMSATRRRYPTYNWIDSETTRPVNPWALHPSTTPTITRRTASRTTSTTPMTTEYVSPTTASPTTTRNTSPPTTATTSASTTSIRTTTERPMTTISRAPPSTSFITTRTTTVTSTPMTTLFTSEMTTITGTRPVSFGPHRTRTTTESTETTVDTAVTLSKKAKGILNDSSIIVNELKDSCMECICTGSSETCNFDVKFRCDKEDECGPYQIDYAYWYEAGYPNFKGNGDVDFHECVTDRTCAEKTVRTYLEKNKLDCNADGMIDCIDYAALHKAGPDSCHKQFVYESKYWTSFSQCHGFDIFKRR